MLPAARGRLWRKPHLVTTYGVICKPGLVGAVRPDTRGARRRRPLADRRHDPRPRHRRRQGRPLGHHARPRPCSARASRSSPTPSATDRPGGPMPRYDVVVIGAGAAGLSAAALLATEGRSVLVLEASPLAGRPRHGGARRGLHDQRRAATSSRTRARASPRSSSTSARSSCTAPSRATWPSGRTAAGTRPASSTRADKGELKKLIGILMETPYEDARRVGRPHPARVDAAAHHQRGRHRALGVHHRARGDHRELVGPLGLGQPLHAQDALLREARRRLLVLAGAGVGRHVPRPARRGRRARRRGAAEHARRAGGDRGRRLVGRGGGARAARDPERDLRGGGASRPAR